MMKNRSTKTIAPAQQDEPPAWMASMKEGPVSDDEKPTRLQAPGADRLIQRVDRGLEEAARRLGLVSLRGRHTWPRLMPLADVVAIQTMSATDDDASKARRYAMGMDLAVDCDQGRLACVRRTVDTVWRDRVTGESESRPGVLHFLQADDVVLWLASRQEPASEYVLAWKSGSDRAAEPQTWGDVAAGRHERKGKPWSDAEKRITREEFQRRRGWKRSPSGGWKRDGDIARAMALECGYSDAAARTALQRVLGNEPDKGATALSAMAGDLSRSRK